MSDLCQWISVKERLPELGNRVIVYIDDYPGFMEFAQYCSEYPPTRWKIGYYYCGDEVTHWMPAPNMPNGEPHAASVQRIITPTSKVWARAREAQP